MPLPPGYSSDSNEDQPPVFSLPPPALDLSSANLTGSLFHHGPGAPPGGFFQTGTGNEDSTTRRGGEGIHREYERVKFEHVEHIGNVNASQSRGDKDPRQEYHGVTFEHVEDAGESITKRNR